MPKEFQELMLETLMKWSLVEQINGGFKLSLNAVEELEKELKKTLDKNISKSELVEAIMCVALRKTGSRGLEDEELYQVTNTMFMLTKLYLSIKEN